MNEQSIGAPQISRRRLLGKVLVAAAAAHTTQAFAFAITAPSDGNLAETTPQMIEILHLIKIRAGQDKVYTALSTAEGIRNWRTRDATLDPRPGGGGEFGFYDHRMLIEIRVAELNPPTRIAWDVISSTGGRFDGTAISFDLSSQDGVASVLFAQRGFTESGEGIASATTRWGFYLLSLKRYLETGHGTPNPDDTDLIR